VKQEGKHHGGTSKLEVPGQPGFSVAKRSHLYAKKFTIGMWLARQTQASVHSTTFETTRTLEWSK
jgi:hypothetical protein